MNSQDIIRAFGEGRFTGAELPIERIETVISHVFLSGRKAYKFYKDDSAFFNENFADLSNTENRLTFIRSDFSWNHTLSPETYLNVQAISFQDGQLTFVEDGDEAEHLVIIMNRVDTNKGLLPLLMAGDLSRDDFIQIGKTLSQRLDLLPRPPADANLEENFLTRLEDLRSWIAGLPGQLSQEEADGYMEYLSTFFKKNSADMTTAGSAGSCADIHCGNGLYVDGKLLLIDTYPPKKDWRLGHKDFDLYRLAVDVYAFCGEGAFRTMLLGYKEGTGRVFNRALEPFFVIYVACIMVPYLYSLGQDSELHRVAGEKYHAFLREYYRLLAH